MSSDLHFVSEYPYPPERVWDGLTCSDALAAWLMPNDFAPEIGRSFQFRMPPQPGWNGIVDCQVTVLDPPRTLAYTWRGDVLDTLLTFTLEPIPMGTRLTVVHSGFKGMRGNMIRLMMGGGWKSMFAKGLPEVLRRLERGEPLAPRVKDCAV